MPAVHVKPESSQTSCCVLQESLVQTSPESLQTSSYVLHVPSDQIFYGSSLHFHSSYFAQNFSSSIMPKLPPLYKHVIQVESGFS